MTELLNCPFCGGSAKISTRTDECIWSHDQVEWTAVSCSGGPDFDCFQPSVDWPTSATDDNGTQLSISQWNRRALPAAPDEDVRAGAHQAGMILGLQMAADIASAHDYTIQSSSAADLRAIQICNAILALIPEAKP